jgi:hypothetical protein
MNQSYYLNNYDTHYLKNNLKSAIYNCFKNRPLIFGFKYTEVNAINQMGYINNPDLFNAGG